MEFKSREGSERWLLLWVGLCAGTLGAVVAIISVVARARYWETPELPPLGVAMFVGITGFIAGLLVIAILLKLVGLDGREPRSLFIWLLVGIVYGVTLPLITGALIPPGTVLVETVLGQMPASRFFSNLLDSLFHMPWAALIQGFQGVPAGLVAGAILALISWFIDIAYCSSNRRISRYGPPAIAVTFVTMTLVLVLFGPASWLSRVGWGPS